MPVENSPGWHFRTVSSIKKIPIKRKLPIRGNPNVWYGPMKKKLPAAIVITIWLILISMIMLFANRIDLEIFFILWVLGLLVIVELIDTRFSDPVYIRYLKYIIASGIIIFGGIFSTKVMEILIK
jgi:hypothetical protein